MDSGAASRLRYTLLPNGRELILGCVMLALASSSLKKVHANRNEIELTNNVELEGSLLPKQNKSAVNLVKIEGEQKLSRLISLGLLATFSV